MPKNPRVISRVRQHMLLLRAEKLQETINRRVSNKHPRVDRGMEINNQRNAKTFLNSLLAGELTKVDPKRVIPETPESIAEKMKTHPDLIMYDNVISGYLKLLGYGQMLERKGIKAALQQYIAERNLAVRKEAERKARFLEK